jgi:hypothetical protein
MRDFWQYIFLLRAAGISLLAGYAGMALIWVVFLIVKLM